MLLARFSQKELDKALKQSQNNSDSEELFDSNKEDAERKMQMPELSF